MTSGATDKSHNRTTGTIGLNNVEVTYVSKKLIGVIYCIYKSNWKYCCSRVEKMPENLQDTLHGNVHLFVVFPKMVPYDLDSTDALTLPSGPFSPPPPTHICLCCTGILDVPQAYSHLMAFALAVPSIQNAFPPDITTAQFLPLCFCSNAILLKRISLTPFTKRVRLATDPPTVYSYQLTFYVTIIAIL